MRLYLGVIVRVRECRWTAPMRWYREEAHLSAHGSQCALAGGQSPSTRSCRCIILCRVSGSVMCELRPSSHRTIGVMLRSVEASSKASEAIGTGSSLSRLALQPASIYSRVSKDYAAAVVSARQVAQAATTLRCRQDQSTSVSQTPQGSDLPVEGFTWVTCGSIPASVASDWCHH